MEEAYLIVGLSLRKLMDVEDARAIFLLERDSLSGPI